MKKSAYYLYRRLFPFFVLFTSTQLVLRAVLAVRQYDFLDGQAVTYLKMFALGFVFDVEVFSFLAIPLLIYIALLPHRLHNTRLDKWLMGIGYFLFSYVILFDFVAENIFWTEFASRFNFIAVDYLVYTNEVIGNIAESYPLPLLLSGIATVSLIILYISRKALFSEYEKNFGFKKSSLLFIVSLIFPVSMFFLVDINLSKISKNQYINEIASSGIYNLFWAYHNNEIDYKSFYLTDNEDKIRSNIRKLLTEESEEYSFTNKNSDDVTRVIKRSGEELHKNVVIVVMESMSGAFMSHFGNKDAITPNLDYLADNSIFFTKLYATGTRTVRGLEAITLSVPPTPGQSIIRRPENKNLFSLGFIFKDRGYDTRFIYGGHGYFDNMNYFFENNGFSIVDRNSFSEDEVEFSNVWGVCDEDLFHKTLSEADKSYSFGKKFMHVVMTTSNHRPYTYPNGRIDIPSKDGGRYGGVKYADFAIGKLIEEARNKPWFNDTVFVFVADHTAGSAGKIELDPEKYHIPLMFYSPSSLSPIKYEKMASQIDVAPVLLGLLNFSYYTKFFGEDVLNDDDEIPHAFISSYQKVGIIKEDQLTVLEPKKAVHAFVKEKDVGYEDIDKSILFDAVTYYQFASGWRERMKRINTVVQ